MENDAVTLSERAVTLDPQNVRALTVLANALLDRVSDHYSNDPQTTLRAPRKRLTRP